MEVGNVNSKHLILALKVKSVLDPCEEENDEMEDRVSLGADSAQNDESSESDSKVNQSQENQYMVTPVANEQPEEANDMVDEDNTQDPKEDEQQLARVKDWVNSRHLDTVELADVLSYFPDISVVLTEEIIHKLVKEGVVFKTGTDTYTTNKQKIFDYEFTFGDKAAQIDDNMHMKALYHALPMKYVTATKLQNKLDGEVNQTTVRKLIDRMTKDGYLEAKGNGRLGKRVIQSVPTEKKLMEVGRAFDNDVMGTNMLEAHDKSNHLELQTMGNNSRDNSTGGILHSIGSDLTRMMIRSEVNQDGSVRSEQTISKTKDHGTPISRPDQPAASRESFALGADNGNANCCNEADTVICSRPTREKSRKTSMVKEPIIQYMKRQKSQAA